MTRIRLKGQYLVLLVMEALESRWGCGPNKGLACQSLLSSGTPNGAISHRHLPMRSMGRMTLRMSFPAVTMWYYDAIGRLCQSTRDDQFLG